MHADKDRDRSLRSDGSKVMAKRGPPCQRYSLLGQRWPFGIWYAKDEIVKAALHPHC